MLAVMETATAREYGMPVQAHRDETGDIVDISFDDSITGVAETHPDIPRADLDALAGIGDAEVAHLIDKTGAPADSSGAVLAVTVADGPHGPVATVTGLDLS